MGAGRVADGLIETLPIVEGNHSSECGVSVA